MKLDTGSERNNSGRQIIREWYIGLRGIEGLGWEWSSSQWNTITSFQKGDPQDPSEICFVFCRDNRQPEPWTGTEVWNLTLGDGCCVLFCKDGATMSGMLGHSNKQTQFMSYGSQTSLQAPHFILPPVQGEVTGVLRMKKLRSEKLSHPLGGTPGEEQVQNLIPGSGTLSDLLFPVQCFR